MVSQILSSLIFAGSRIQVPNVCGTLTKCTGLPTEVMTHSSGEKARVHYRAHSNSKWQLVTANLAAYHLYLKDQAFCLQFFQPGYHHSVQHRSQLQLREKG